jgi:predicted nuclease of predicted toxin-antitoxin system
LDTNIRLYFDENVEITVADQIRLRGIQAVTVRDLNLLGDSDENHLQRATLMGYVLCTYDMDYLRLHHEGIPHSGIIFAREQITSIGDWIYGLELICGVLTLDDMKNHVEYLSV